MVGRSVDCLLKIFFNQIIICCLQSVFCKWSKVAAYRSDYSANVDYN